MDDDCQLQMENLLLDDYRLQLVAIAIAKNVVPISLHNLGMMRTGWYNDVMSTVRERFHRPDILDGMDAWYALVAEAEAELFPTHQTDPDQMQIDQVEAMLRGASERWFFDVCRILEVLLWKNVSPGWFEGLCQDDNNHQLVKFFRPAEFEQLLLRGGIISFVGSKDLVSKVWAKVLQLEVRLLVYGGRHSELDALMARNYVTFPDFLAGGNDVDDVFHLAARHGHRQTIEWMLRAGAQNGLWWDFDDAIVGTPMHWAAMRAHKNVVRMLVKAGASIETPSQALQHRTPLHLACENGHATAVHVLVEAGADIHACDLDGLTPAMLALQRGEYDFFYVNQLLATVKLRSREERKVKPR